MTAVVDSGVLVAAADRRDRLHDDAAGALHSLLGELVIPEPVTAEADYLIGRRVGRDARLRFLDDLGRGLIEVACLSPSEFADAVAVDRRYDALDLGLADAAIVVVAHRYDTRTLVTFDDRCFRAVAPLQGGSFTLLPADG